MDIEPSEPLMSIYQVCTVFRPPIEYWPLRWARANPLSPTILLLPSRHQTWKTYFLTFPLGNKTAVPILNKLIKVSLHLCRHFRIKTVLCFIMTTDFPIIDLRFKIK